MATNLLFRAEPRLAARRPAWDTTCARRGMPRRIRSWPDEIYNLAAMIAEVAGFGGRIVYDTSKPGGTPRKLLDVGRLTALGWRASTSLRAGIRKALDGFLAAGA